MDRASHLRDNPATLEQLWQKAKIIHFSRGRLAVNSGASQLRFLTAAEIKELIASGEFKSGESYFLGLGQLDSVPYFAWNSPHLEYQEEVAPT